MKKRIILLLIFFTIVWLSVSPCAAAETDLNLTEAESAFIEEHPVIRIGVDPDFVPFEFIEDDGAYQGITADYLSLISEKTGIEFKVVAGLTWPEAYDMALSGDIDALPAIGKTDDREQSFLFSEPYYHFKRVIVTRDTDTEISDMADLAGLTVAVQRNSSHHSYLSSYPEINLSLYDSVEDALTAVATGSERAFVGNFATTNYLIRANGLTNLRFIVFDAEDDQSLYFAARKDWPELISIINKALATVDEDEKIAINNKWIDLEQETDYGPVILVVSIIGGIVVIVFIVSFYWIFRLRKEVEKRKRIQMDLERAKQEADEANAFKSSFMARMSHEIRTPLNAITGMAYLLKKTQLTLTQKTYADRITQAASNMLNIINDILDYSKIEAGKVELEITSFSMDQIIQDVVNIISYKIEEQKIGFHLAKDPQIPNWFFGDPKRIEQVLLNVLNNAVKFTDAGEVSLEIQLIAKENERYHLSFSIKDTGIGMTEEQIRKLFEPFTQGDTSINRRFGGSGLGLSIVENLVELMEGQIQVFSTPKEGSTFVIHLTLGVDKEHEETYLKTLSSGRFHDITTLVLEKTGASMNLIERYLSAFGMRCELTSSEASAVTMLEAADGNFTKPFDLFIIDYDMPAKGGLQFAASVRNDEKIVQKPKIIMLLPMMRADLFDKLDDYDIDIGIVKPIIPSVLLNGILEIFKLKAMAAAQPSENQEALLEKCDRPHTVLVVEDNQTNQLIAKSLLQQVGIESILAVDGKEAVDRYHQYKDKIDLILMDLHMPVMNGYEAAQEIRKVSEGVPIVAMTADVIAGVKEKCEASGIHHYISKPFDPDRFMQTVKEIITAHEEHNTQTEAVLDQAAGLKNIGGNEVLYKELLNEYYKENRDVSNQLSLAVNEKRYDDAVQIVHKMKGSSGSIGAKYLYNLAINLQKVLTVRDEAEIVFLTKEFLDVLQRLLEEITGALK